MAKKWKSFEVLTKPDEGFENPVWYVDVTQRLRDAVDCEGDGVMQLFVPHTTCCLIMNSGVDGTTLHDIRMFIEEQVPTTGPFVHLHDGPQDAAAHVRIQFGLNSLTLPIKGGELGLGHSQGIYMLEFDGPRKRTVQYAVNPF